MQLEEALDVQSPLIWAVTSEPARVIDAVAHHIQDKKPVLFMEPITGLLEFDTASGLWKKVLAEWNSVDENGNQEASQMPILTLDMALNYASEKKGVICLSHAHTFKDKLLPYFTSISLQFRAAVISGNTKELPPQVILISHEDEVPPEIVRDTVKISFDLPTEEDIKNILAKVQKETAAELGNEPDILVRSTQGLSETEIFRIYGKGLSSSGTLNPNSVAKDKAAIMKQGGNIEVCTPELTLESIGGLDNAKELIHAINWIWNAPREAEALGVMPLRRLLFVGVPGTGKSAICEATAKSLGLELARTGISQQMNKYIGESEANMRRTFQQVRALAPIVLWIDEFGRDLSGSASSSSTDGGTTNRVHGEFLTGLQELPNNVFLMCAANSIDSLPPEMTRADRFDKIMFIGFPTPSERKEIFKIHLGRFYEDYNLNDLATATELFTGAEIKSLINEAMFEWGTKHRRRPETADICAMAPLMRNRVWLKKRDEVLTMYQRALVEWSWASSKQEAAAEKLLNAAGITPLSEEKEERDKEGDYKIQKFSSFL